MYSVQLYKGLATMIGIAGCVCGGSNFWFVMIMYGPDLKILTHFQEGGDPCLLIDFASFCSNYIPIFQKFLP